MKVIGYVRCSTEEQSVSGLGIDAQRAQIGVEATRRGWKVDWVVDNGSGKNTKRTGLQRALTDLEEGRAGALVVARLDRLTRSWRDLGNMLEAAHSQGWAVVALDLGVDTTTPSGEAMAGVAAVFGQLERRLISERTKLALEQARSRGVRLGGRPVVPDDVRTRILEARAEGLTLQQVADALTEEGVPTGKSGVRWYPSTVRSIIGKMQALIDEAPGDVYEALRLAREINERIVPESEGRMTPEDHNRLRLALGRQGQAFRVVLYARSADEKRAGLNLLRSSTRDAMAVMAGRST